MDETEHGPIDTGGGAMIDGNADTHGGNIIGRDQIIHNVFQLDIARLVEILRQNLPAGDPLPQNLLKSLQEFQYLHTRLHEWKKLHNCMNTILTDLGQFRHEVDRVEMTRRVPNPQALGRLWRPVRRDVLILLDWAATVRYIAETPFGQLDKGVQGPAWAVEMFTTKNRLDDLLGRPAVDMAWGGATSRPLPAWLTR
ncbi:MAG TPA: hypothetical protein VF498_03735, partial [Anaerolineales bacterium]